MPAIRKLLIAIALVSAQTAVAATFPVVGNADVGAGTLRQAILDANATPGADTIAFALPAGQRTILITSASLPLITDPVAIDGTTNPGFATNVPVVEVRGGGDGFQGFRFSAGSSNSSLRGLVVNRFGAGSVIVDPGVSGVTIAGNWLGLDPSGIATGGAGDTLILNGDSAIVGGAASDRNVIVGDARIAGSGNLVVGNYFGTNADGTTRSVINTVVRAAGVGTHIGGVTASTHNVITSLTVSGNVVVEGNYIGVGADGAASLGPATTLLTVAALSSAPPFPIIGGTTAGAGNIIANGLNGIFLFTPAIVQGNTLRNFTSAAINVVSGSPTASSASGSIIGGIAAGTGNVITASGIGVVITQPQTVSVEITSNSIFGNTRAIELTPATPTPNDPAPDADTGQNDLQNYPNITFAERTAVGATIRGTLVSAPSTTYLVQIFATPAPDAEAKTLLGSLTITTDATGSATFELSTTGASPALGDLITATATNRALAAVPGSSPNSTSEVSPAVAVAVSIPVERPFVLALLAAAIAAAGVFAARR